MKQYIRALTIAGSDSGGGAGIQADLKTFAALGCYGLTVITALTAQNTLGVQAIHPVPVDFIRAQITSVLGDIGADAIKIGMLHNNEVITVVSECLQYYKAQKVVLDPVMIAKDGSELLNTEAIASLKKLFPLITLLTPNIMEAEMLCQFPIYNRKDMQAAAKFLCQQGCAAVLVKGGHLAIENSSNDCLYIKEDDSCHWLESSRIVSTNTHGTGCTLTAAITALLAHQNALVTVVKRAKQYIFHAIDQGKNYSLGSGWGPVQHFFNNEGKVSAY